MGTTADKLNKILSSKEAIRTSIANKGVDITSATPLSEYASKIDSIEKGGGISFNIDTNVSNGTDLKGITTSITNKGLPTINFTIEGSLSESDGVYSGFSTSNYITDIYNTNSEEVILRIKFKTGSNTSTLQNILHIENVVNFELSSNKFQCYQWQGETTTTFLSPSTDTWYYACIKFSEHDTSANTVRKQYYVSTTGFSTESTDLVANFTDEIATNTSQNCIGLASYDYSNPFLGSVDMQATCVVDFDGNYVRQYYIPSED